MGRRTKNEINAVRTSKTCAARRRGSDSDDRKTEIDHRADFQKTEINSVRTSKIRGARGRRGTCDDDRKTEKRQRRKTQKNGDKTGSDVQKKEKPADSGRVFQKADQAANFCCKTIRSLPSMTPSPLKSYFPSSGVPLTK